MGAMVESNLLPGSQPLPQPPVHLRRARRLDHRSVSHRVDRDRIPRPRGPRLAVGRVSADPLVRSRNQSVPHASSTRPDGAPFLTHAASDPIVREAPPRYRCLLLLAAIGFLIPLGGAGSERNPQHRNRIGAGRPRRQPGHQQSLRRQQRGQRRHGLRWRCPHLPHRAGGSAPAGIGVNLFTNTIYVVNNGSNDVTVIDGATNATRTVAVGVQLIAVAVIP